MCYDAIERWLGLTVDDLSFEDYCFYSGILQAEGLQEYSNNFRRRMFSSSSAIFWMYNDCWPASHGWTIVDYYLRRKLAYHPVRRAFAPVNVIPVVDGDTVRIFGVNDTPEPWIGEARFGLFRLDGKTIAGDGVGLHPQETEGMESNSIPNDDLRRLRRRPPATESPEIDGGEGCAVTLPANASTVIGEIPIERWKSLGEDSSGAFALLQQEGRTVAQNRVFVTRFKDLKWAEPQISVERRGDMAVFTSPTFVWAVCLDPDCESPIADDVFDLLPGIPYEVPWPEDKPLPIVRRCGQRIWNG